MFKPEKLYNLIQSNGLVQKELFDKVGISSQAWRDACSGSDIGVRKVERVADYFHVPIDYFFDREVGMEGISGPIGYSVNGLINHVSGNIIIGQYENEIKHLKEILAEKERTINILMKLQDVEEKRSDNL